ncbi:MAG TPA: HAD family hydrolase [Flavobacteriales bacterium]|nr:HAD family hydrolase [Flavobacteriales bacterium]
MALFDLDGTITRADTMLEYLAYAHGRAKLAWWLALVFPAWVLAKLGLAHHDTPKRMLVRLAFAGQQVAEQEKTAHLFTLDKMPGLLREAALERIWEHKRHGATVVIVTASCSLWVEPWCRQHGLELLATELETGDGRYTGRLRTPNCRGKEKVARIRAHLGDLSGLDIHAYGDTPGDKPMLALAREPHYKPFR